MGDQRTGRQKARCPECLAPIWLKDSVELWDPTTCPECHTALQVVRVHPLELDYMDSSWEAEEFEEEDFGEE